MMRYVGLLFSIFAFTVTSPLTAKPFVSAKLVGQLGNQMFQIAAATVVALDNGAEAIFPDLVNSKEHGIPLNYEKVFFDLKTKIKRDYDYRFYSHKCPYLPIPYHPNMLIEGWFQSEKYFSHRRDDILKLFAPSTEIHNYLTSTYADILSEPCTVAIHHRSYMKEDPKQHFHPTQTKEYFLKAISHFPEDALFVVCSNDILWCKWNFSDIPRDFIFIENEPYYHDLYLMSMCTHNIVSNSSFSWWSAYLNQNPNKIVVAPRQWFAKTSGQDFRDVIPESWIAID